MWELAWRRKALGDGKVGIPFPAKRSRSMPTLWGWSMPREAGTQLTAWSVFLYWATALVKGTYHPPNWQTTGNTTTKRNVEISEIEKTIT